MKLNNEVPARGLRLSANLYEDAANLSSEETRLLEDILKLPKDEIEQINRTYDIFDEEHRLSSKAARVEFLTTFCLLEKSKKLSPLMHMFSLLKIDFSYGII